MKIVQINTVYSSGSTGKIAAALYTLTKENGFESSVAYGRGLTPAEYDIGGYKIGTKVDFYKHVLYNFTTGKCGYASKSNTVKFLNWLDNEKPDLLHLHNLHGFYIHVGMLFDYIKEHNIPVVWTLHDCWPFTGNCAYFDYIECEKWKTGCHDCQIHRSDYPYSIFKDNSILNYQMKKDTFTGVKNLTIVTPSRWLADLVKKSFLGEYPVHIIPNGIDLDIFNIANEEDINALRSKYPLIQNKKILLGVASTWEERKGLNYLLRLSGDLDPEKFIVVIIGLSHKQADKISKKYKDKVIAIERTENQSELATWYSSAFAYVNPTLQDNFPTTNLEAIACGTPVITFKTGGSPESINDQTGIVVPKGDYDELLASIKAFAQKVDMNPASTTTLLEDCRKHALGYSKTGAFGSYINLYKTICYK